MIINNRDIKLLTVIKSNINWATEIIICVAYYRSSGFNEISKEIKTKNKVEVITGRDFYQTEPKALLDSFLSGIKIYFQKNSSKLTFHPKVYIFKKGKKYRAIIGSSNMTKGGLSGNSEISIIIDSKNNKKEIDKLLESINNYKESRDFELITSKLLIENYKIKFNKYHRTLGRQQKKAEKEINKIFNFEIDHFKSYIDEHRDFITEKFEEKNEKYQIAKSQLKKINAAKYKKSTSFMEDYQIVLNNFYSSGLNRGKSIYSEQFVSIKKIIKLAIKANSKNNEDVFKRIRIILNSIPRMGINAITEILNTFHPKIFPVLNNRTLSVLRSLGLINNKDSNLYSDEEYFQYKDLMTEIKKVCKMKDFRETDLAISFYYDDVVK